MNAIRARKNDQFQSSCNEEKNIMEVKYIDFVFDRKSKSGKTKIWDVITYENDWLGEIKWFSRWRRYAFHPLGHTVYEQDCLRKIADFCEEQTTNLRKTWKRRINK